MADAGTPGVDRGEGLGRVALVALGWGCLLIRARPRQTQNAFGQGPPGRSRGSAVETLASHQQWW